MFLFVCVKGADAVMSHHGNCVKQALVDLFPELGLQKELFWDKCTFFVLIFLGLFKIILF